MRPLLGRCLRKDAKQRLQAIGDARIQIDELISGTSEDVAAPRAPRAASRRVAPVAIAASGSAAVIAALAMWAPDEARAAGSLLPSRFEIVPPPDAIAVVQGAIATSPSHPTAATSSTVPARAARQLVVRAIDRLDARPLPGITNARQPFFSPDSQWIGFFDGVGLKKVPIAGGSAITICRKSSGRSRGASWGDDNSIVFASHDTATDCCACRRAAASRPMLTTPDTAKGETESLVPVGAAGRPRRPVHHHGDERGGRLRRWPSSI